MPTRSPRRSSLLAHVLPLLQPLLDTQATLTTNGQPTKDSDTLTNHSPPLLVTVEMGRVDDTVAMDAVAEAASAMDTVVGGEDDERKTKITLCKTGR